MRLFEPGDVVYFTGWAGLSPGRPGPTDPAINAKGLILGYHPDFKNLFLVRFIDYDKTYWLYSSEMTKHNDQV